MSRPPDEQLQKHRRQINSFLREPVVYPASICLFYLSGDDSCTFEFLQTVRQDVGGNPFARCLEFLKRPETANHQIADD